MQIIFSLYGITLNRLRNCKVLTHILRNNILFFTYFYWKYFNYFLIGIKEIDNYELRFFLNSLEVITSKTITIGSAI